VSTDPFDFLNQATPPGWPSRADQRPLNSTAIVIGLCVFAAIMLSGAFIAWRLSAQLNLLSAPNKNARQPDQGESPLTSTTANSVISTAKVSASVGEAKSDDDVAAISNLIKQLGNSEFAERTAAAKSLESIGLPALDALRAAVRDSDPEVAGQAKRLVEVIESGLDQLLLDYRGYGLPLPPDDAKLVRFESGGRYILNDKLMPPTYFLGFLLRPGIKDRPALLLVGTQEIQLESFKTIEFVEAKPELVKSLDPQWRGQATFEMNAGLAIALQCEARGWKALAQELWASSLKQKSGDHFGAFFQPANLPNRTALAYLAWAYSGNELVKPDTERAKSAKRMRALMAAEPRLNTEIGRALLASLDSALVPSTAKVGTVERLIADLTDTCNTNRKRDELDPRYSTLADMGFDAVPTLLEHLDDDRLTRSVKQGFNNFPTWILRVKDVASDLMQELAGEELGKDWLRRQQGWPVEKGDAQAWWDKARNSPESLAPAAGGPPRRMPPLAKRAARELLRAGNLVRRRAQRERDHQLARCRGDRRDDSDVSGDQDRPPRKRHVGSRWPDRAGHRLPNYACPAGLDRRSRRADGRRYYSAVPKPAGSRL
jgi:hypothetical protein